MHDAGVLALLGVIAGAASAWLFYLGSRNQRLLARALPTALSLSIGVALSGFSILLLAAVMSRVAAVFAWATLVMLLTTTVPFVFASRRRAQGDGHERGAAT